MLIKLSGLKLRIFHELVCSTTVISTREVGRAPTEKRCSRHFPRFLTVLNRVIEHEFQPMKKLLL